MHLEKTLAEDAMLLTVDADRIDAANAVYLKDAFSAAICCHTGRVVMDLEAVKFMDSSGLGAMVAAMKQLDRARKLELCNLQPALVKVFALTRMNTIFVIHQNLKAAMTGPASGSDSASAA